MTAYQGICSLMNLWHAMGVQHSALQQLCFIPAGDLYIHLPFGMPAFILSSLPAVMCMLDVLFDAQA